MIGDRVNVYHRKIEDSSIVHHGELRFNGIFLGWGNKNGTTTALVKDNDGIVYNVNAELLKFMNN